MTPEVFYLIAAVLCIVAGVFAAIDRAVPVALLCFGVALIAFGLSGGI